ncbi:MAG: hypothetical protein HC910_02035 [Spirulinaceae cyanobacterium SM2_1_0]|nr:hypothetical protein [Spirulinaceae cyanobacterium SM2_1_0]
MVQVFPDTRHQRCWVHETANVLNPLPKSQHRAARSLLWEISRAATQAEAELGIGRFAATFDAQSPPAMACLVRDRPALLAFSDFPAEHWQHRRMTNPIESAFAPVRLRFSRYDSGTGVQACSERLATLAATAGFLPLA